MTADSLPLIQELLHNVCRQGADGADALLMQSREVGMTRRLGKLEHLERAEHSSLSLRVFKGHKQAIASTTDLRPTALHTLAERSLQMAGAASEDPLCSLAQASQFCTQTPPLDLYDGTEPDETWLAEQCRVAEDTALSHTGIRNSEGADAGYSMSQVSLAVLNREGEEFARHYDVSHFSISVSVVAGEKTQMERDYGFTSSRHRGDLQSAETVGHEAAQRALKRLNPRRVATCEVPIIFDPRVGKSLLSAFAGAINGSTIARGTSFLKDAMGTQVFSTNVIITDDPHRPRGLASKPFDGEGIANRKRALVQNGVLQSWLLDLRSAAKLGLVTTGHAARGIGAPPSPSATNLYMEAGDVSPAELLSGVKNGFYVTEAFGMGVNLVTGDYSQGAAGFWIENGTLAYPVSEVTIAGKLPDMFISIIPASDLEFRYGTNTPTFMIGRMTVAGT